MESFHQSFILAITLESFHIVFTCSVIPSVTANVTLCFKRVTPLTMDLSRKIKSRRLERKEKIKITKKQENLFLNLHWLRFCSELQPWLSKTEALTIWLSVTSLFSLFVIPQYPHYPVGVRDRCNASRTFGRRTVGM